MLHYIYINIWEKWVPQNDIYNSCWRVQLKICKCCRKLSELGNTEWRLHWRLSCATVPKSLYFSMRRDASVALRLSQPARGELSFSPYSKICNTTLDKIQWILELGSWSQVSPTFGSNLINRQYDEKSASQTSLKNIHILCMVGDDKVAQSITDFVPSNSHAWNCPSFKFVYHWQDKKKSWLHITGDKLHW